MLFNGFEVILDSSLVEYFTEYPQERFIEYGPEDDWWLLKFGYAKRSRRPSKSGFVVNDRYLIIHPETWAAVQADLERRNRETAEAYYGGKADVRHYVK